MGAGNAAGPAEPGQGGQSSTQRTAAWRARRGAKRAAHEADLQAALGQEEYDKLLAKRLACKARVARHRAQAAVQDDA